MMMTRGRQAVAGKFAPAGMDIRSCPQYMTSIIQKSGWYRDMTEFTELLEGFQRDDDAWTVTVSDDWLQGRTVYGGLGAALCLEATQRSIPDLPPLRSAQVSFAGPATGRLRIHLRVLGNQPPPRRDRQR